MCYMLVNYEKMNEMSIIITMLLCFAGKSFQLTLFLGLSFSRAVLLFGKIILFRFKSINPSLAALDGEDWEIR
jgi:hypothetical protein